MQSFFGSTPNRCHSCLVSGHWAAECDMAKDPGSASDKVPMPSLRHDCAGRWCWSHRSCRASRHQQGSESTSATQHFLVALIGLKQWFEVDLWPRCLVQLRPLMRTNLASKPSRFHLHGIIVMPVRSDIYWKTDIILNKYNQAKMIHLKHKRF